MKGLRELKRECSQLESEAANLRTIIARHRADLDGFRSVENLRETMVGIVKKDRAKEARHLECMNVNAVRAVNVGKLIEAGQLAAADDHVVSGVVVGIGGEGDSEGLAVLRVETSHDQLRERAKLGSVVVTVPADRYRHLLRAEKQAAASDQSWFMLGSDGTPRVEAVQP